MAQRGMIDGVVYDIQGGRGMRDGVVYDIRSGRGMRDGVVYDISLGDGPVSVLEDNSWANIRAASDAGIAADLWKVGDTKTIVLNGTVGNTTFDNLAVDLFIVGFDHNSEVEGANRIHFQLGRIGGKDVCLCDSAYGTEVSAAGYFAMDPDGVYGPWSSSPMRKNILGGDVAPTSPRSNTLMACLPADLRSVMKSVVKYTSRSALDSASAVVSTTDYISLMAEYEVHGRYECANMYEQNYQEQYAYYANGNKKQTYKHTQTGAAAMRWLRSMTNVNSNTACEVEANGSANQETAERSLGIAPILFV